MIPINNDKQEDQEETPFRIIEETRPGKIIHIYFSEAINEAKKFVDLIHKIKTAGPEDIIYMYLNLPGGYITTGVQILSAMRMSKAHIVTVVEGEVASLGTLIFLSADEFIIHDNTLLMIHNHSGGQWGKGHEYLAQADATSKWFETLARDVYKNFLTPTEIKEMLDGKDFWFQADEVKTRLEKLVKESQKAAKANEPKTRTRTTKK